MTHPSASSANGGSEVVMIRSPTTPKPIELPQTHGINGRRADGQAPRATLANNGSGSERNPRATRQNVFSGSTVVFLPRESFAFDHDHFATVVVHVECDEITGQALILMDAAVIIVQQLVLRGWQRK